MTFELLTADQSHVNLLTCLGRKLFKETYFHVNTAQDMESYLDETYNQKKQTEELNDPGWTTLMVLDEGVPIAFAQIVETEQVYEFIPDKQAIELKRIYVDKDYIGKGVGKLLMLQVLEKVKRKDTLWLGVWKENDRAIGFYEKFGFNIVGEHVFRLGEKEGRDWVMAKRL